MYELIIKHPTPSAIAIQFLIGLAGVLMIRKNTKSRLAYIAQAVKSVKSNKVDGMYRASVAALVGGTPFLSGAILSLSSGNFLYCLIDSCVWLSFVVLFWVSVPVDRKR
jgi:hypothetical protein